MELEDFDTRVLVCGDRNWADQKIVGTILFGFLEEAMIDMGNLVGIYGVDRLAIIGANRSSSMSPYITSIKQEDR